LISTHEILVQGIKQLWVTANLFEEEPLLMKNDRLLGQVLKRIAEDKTAARRRELHPKAETKEAEKKSSNESASTIPDHPPDPLADKIPGDPTDQLLPEPKELVSDAREPGDEEAADRSKDAARKRGANEAELQAPADSNKDARSESEPSAQGRRPGLRPARPRTAVWGGNDEVEL